MGGNGSIIQNDDLPLALPDGEVRRVVCSLHLLSFCGRPDQPKGLGKCVVGWGAKCTVYDVEIDPNHNFVDEGR